MDKKIKRLKIRMCEERAHRKKSINELAKKINLAPELITEFIENDPKAYKLANYQNKILAQVLKARNYVGTNSPTPTQHISVINNNNGPNSSSTTVINSIIKI